MQMVPSEWRRELPDAEAPTGWRVQRDIPYGLRVQTIAKRWSGTGEHQALMLMMDIAGAGLGYSSIVSDLNEKGFRQRDSRHGAGLPSSI